MLTRRQLFKRSAVGGVGLIAARGATFSFAQGSKPLAKFVDPLPTPGQAGWPVRPLHAGGATNVQIRNAAVKVHRDLPPTKVWTYNSASAPSTFLGDTLVVQKDVPLTVNYRNVLTAPVIPFDPALVPPTAPAPTGLRINTHLHGGHIIDDADGNPYFSYDTAAPNEYVPGQTQTVTYANDQPAALLFYHDHAIGITRNNVYAGLAGGYRIDDAPNATLPSGARDIPLVIQDRDFTGNGNLNYPAKWVPEFFGKTVLVNGKAWPFLNVDRRKYRFRILNGSNSRFYHLQVPPGVQAWQIGGDLGLLGQAVPIQSILVAPAERADVVFDFSGVPAGTRLQLTDVPLPVGTVSPTAPIGPIMQFRLRTSVVNDPAPQPAGPVPNLAPGAPRTITLDEVLKNKKPVAALLNNTHFMNMQTGQVIRNGQARLDRVRVGSVEDWYLVNLTADTHPIHVHLVHFQVVERRWLTQQYVDDLAAARATNPHAVVDIVPSRHLGPSAGTVPAWEKSWKDTVRSNPADPAVAGGQFGQVTRIRARFDLPAGDTPPTAGNPKRYVYHCHILEHEDNEMMRPYEVTA